MTRAPAAALVALALVAGACGGGQPVADGPGPAEAPTEVTVGEDVLVLSTYAWQDQMPTVGDEPGPCASLCVNGTVEVASGEALPEDLEVLEIVAVVDGERFEFGERELVGRLGPSNYEFVVRRGPTLEPGTTFDLAVLLDVQGEEQWVRARQVTVERTV
jgi:hypothetical protein